jgi:hypothetical protein
MDIKWIAGRTAGHVVCFLDERRRRIGNAGTATVHCSTLSVWPEAAHKYTPAGVLAVKRPLFCKHKETEAKIFKYFNIPLEGHNTVKPQFTYFSIYILSIYVLYIYIFYILLYIRGQI